MKFPYGPVFQGTLMSIGALGLISAFVSTRKGNTYKAEPAGVTMSDLMPKDKRTRAYKEWLKREKQRQRKATMEGVVSLRFLPFAVDGVIQDMDAYNKLLLGLGDLSVEMAEKYPTEILAIADLPADAQGQSSITPNYRETAKFLSWAFNNSRTIQGMSLTPLTDFQNKARLEQAKKGVKDNEHYFGHYGGGFGGYHSENQPCWSVVRPNAFSQWPQTSERHDRKKLYEQANIEEEFSNHWYPINPTTINSTSYLQSQMGVFPATFWPDGMGDMPSNRDELAIGIMTWLDNLISEYWQLPGSEPSYNSVGKVTYEIQSYGVDAYNTAFRQKSGDEQVKSWNELMKNKEAQEWIESQSLGIRLSVLRDMTLANKFYELVFEDLLSAHDQWVVLAEPSITGNEEKYSHIPRRNLVMPLSNWAKKMSQLRPEEEGWPTFDKIMAEGPSIFTRLPPHSTNPEGPPRDFSSWVFGRKAAQKTHPSHADSAGLLALADDTVYSFNNVIDYTILKECYRDFAKFWRDNQTSAKEEASEAFKEQLAATDEWLKETKKAITKAKPFCYVNFRQQVGPRGGRWDGESANFSIQLRPSIAPDGASRYGPPWGYAPALYTPKQEQAYQDLWVQLYTKYTTIEIPTNPDEVRFMRNKKRISYDEAQKIKAESRSYGSKQKFNSLEGAMRGPYNHEERKYTFKTWGQMFVPVAEKKLEGLYQKMTPESRERVSDVKVAVPTEISDERQVEVDKMAMYQLRTRYQGDLNKESAVDKAKQALANAEKTWKQAQKRLKGMKKTKLPKGENAVLLTNYVNDPTRWKPLLTALGIPIPNVKDE